VGSGIRSGHHRIAFFFEKQHNPSQFVSENVQIERARYMDGQLMAMQVFVKVVDGGSLSAAAEQLELSRPVVSRYVAELEDWVGARLLHRTTRRLSLTGGQRDPAALPPDAGVLRGHAPCAGRPTKPRAASCASPPAPRLPRRN
jgi:hypothetical protein